MDAGGVGIHGHRTADRLRTADGVSHTRRHVRAANIAEGCSRSSRNELAHFIRIAIASGNEIESLLQLAFDAKTLDNTMHAGLQRDLLLMRRMLISLMRALDRKIADDELERRSEASRMR